MKKNMIIALSIITLPFASAAYLIARAVKMQDWQDVPSPAEWIRAAVENSEE